MASAVLDTSRVRIKTRTAFFAQLCVPCAGPVSMRLRRETAAILNDKLRAAEGRGSGVRGVSLIKLPKHVLISIAGSDEAVSHWLEHHRLGTELAAALSQAERQINALDQRPAAPQAGVADHRVDEQPFVGSRWRWIARLAPPRTRRHDPPYAS